MLPKQLMKFVGLYCHWFAKILWYKRALSFLYKSTTNRASRARWASLHWSLDLTSMKGTFRRWIDRSSLRAESHEPSLFTPSAMHVTSGVQEDSGQRDKETVFDDRCVKRALQKGDLPFALLRDS